MIGLRDGSSGVGMRAAQFAITTECCDGLGRIDEMICVERP